MKKIEQKEIERVLTLRKKLAEIREELDPLEDSIVERLVKHARISAGKHMAFLQVRERRVVAWKEKAQQLAKRLGWDPEKWAEKMLARARKEKSWDLKVE